MIIWGKCIVKYIFVSYLLLNNKVPENLVAKSNKYFYCSQVNQSTGWFLLFLELFMYLRPPACRVRISTDIAGISHVFEYHLTWSWSRITLAEMTGLSSIGGLLCFSYLAQAYSHDGSGVHEGEVHHASKDLSSDGTMTLHCIMLTKTKS